MSAGPRSADALLSTTATTPHDMKQDHDCRASEDRADTEPTPSSKYGGWNEECRDAAAPLKQGVIKTLMDRKIRLVAERQNSYVDEQEHGTECPQNLETVLDHEV